MSRLESIIPERKDIDRALGFCKSGKRSQDPNFPYVTKAEPMAKAITDREKLVRRAKAVAAVWGIKDIEGVIDGRQVKVNVWLPFAKRLDELGFTVTQIHEISQYQHYSDPLAVLGIADLIG